MYLHLGQDTVIRTTDLVGIFDIETASVGRITRQFLSVAEARLAVTNVSMDLPKSFVLCVDDTGVRVYVTSISSATLRKRLGSIGSASGRRGFVREE